MCIWGVGTGPCRGRSVEDTVKGQGEAWTPLVVQRLRAHLPVRGPRVSSLVPEDLTRPRAAKEHRNY